MSVSEAERAWERWAKEHRSDLDVNWIAMTAKEAFIAGFAAGRERPGEYVAEAEEEP